MNPKPPTVTELDRACREGYFVFTGNRQGVLGAVNQGKNMMPFKNKCWIHRQRDGAWELVELASITITSEPMKGTNMPEGKRHGGRTPHLRSVKKGADTKAPAKDEVGQVDAAEAQATKSRAPQASFTRSGPGKQGELPGVTTGERRSPEIEEAAERWEDTKLAKAKAVKAHQEADDILVTVMRKKKRTHYSRSTFGVVTVPEPKIHARFAREKQESVKKSRKK